MQRWKKVRGTELERSNEEVSFLLHYDFMIGS
jgi:hypothetical protein